MSRVKTFRIAMCVGIVSACCQTVNGTLITPISVTSSTSSTDLWPASNLIDGSGLSILGSDSATHGETTPTNSWVTNQPGGKNDSDYYNPAYTASAPVLTFQLDKDNKLYALDHIVLWNYAPRLDATDTAKNCAKFITVAFSQTGVDGLFSDPLPLPETLNKGYAGERAQIISFGHAFLANAVRLTITDNWYDGIGTGGGGDRVGLSEVKFLAPEPSSLLLTGTGLFGLVSFVFLARVRKFIVRTRGDVF